MVFPDAERVRSAAVRRARSGLRKVRARFSSERRPIILMYHRIADESFDPWEIAVGPRNFADQLSWLTRNRTPISLGEFADLYRRRALPDDAVAVTFDDGYACTAAVAAPLLERFAVPATVFVPAGLIGRARTFWWDELQQNPVVPSPAASVHALGQDWEIGQPHRGDAVWPSDSRKRTPRQSGFFTLWSRLQPLPASKIEEAMAELRAHGSKGTKASHRLMTVDEARSIKSDRISFGSSTITHTSLPTLSAADKALEISDGMKACEELVGAKPVQLRLPVWRFRWRMRGAGGEGGFRVRLHGRAATRSSPATTFSRSPAWASGIGQRGGYGKKSRKPVSTSKPLPRGHEQRCHAIGLGARARLQCANDTGRHAPIGSGELLFKSRSDCRR